MVLIGNYEIRYIVEVFINVWSDNLMIEWIDDFCYLFVWNNLLFDRGKWKFLSLN